MENDVDSTEQFKILSLCSGSLGIEKGIKAVVPDARTIAYVEIEAFQCFNLVAAMEAGMVDSAPLWTDLKTFDGRPFRGRVHCITAGYPCQPFSTAGQRKGADDPRHLFPHILGIVEAVRPLCCFFENVPGHLTMGYDEVYRNLRDLGYTVEAGLFSASEVGAPHTRQRLFILAYTDDFLQWGKAKHRIVQGEAREIEKAAQREGRHEIQRQRSRAMFGDGRKDVVNANGSQFKSIGDDEKQAESDYNRFRNTSALLWPAQPGHEQYDWEEPRTIESGLGCTVDGYNFRTDLLRTYGNAVVAQTAEKAFRTMIQNILYTSEQ